ncbi:hypothetical protein M758_9G178900 [Ceratodon purpureus]|nr:hypothetical protein M758_9G178900 [Ceratodon purpureus]
MISLATANQPTGLRFRERRRTWSYLHDGDGLVILAFLGCMLDTVRTVNSNQQLIPGSSMACKCSMNFHGRPAICLLGLA